MTFNFSRQATLLKKGRNCYSPHVGLFSLFHSDNGYTLTELTTHSLTTQANSYRYIPLKKNNITSKCALKNVCAFTISNIEHSKPFLKQIVHSAHSA